MYEEHRKSRRRRVFQPAVIVDSDGSVVGACKVSDVSAGGAKLKVDTKIAVPEDFFLHLSEFDTSVRRRCAVVWRSREQTGIRFLDE